MIPALSWSRTAMMKGKPWRAEFTRLNEAYVARHGFPFIIAVRDHDKPGIMAAMARRVDNDSATERTEAERQVARIAELRLKQMLG